MKSTLTFAIIFLLLAIGTGIISFLPAAGHHAYTSGLCFVISGVSFLTYRNERLIEAINQYKAANKSRGESK